MTSPTLSGTQARSIAEATARINIWDGAVRSGKTVSSLIAWCDHITRGPAGPLLMVGKTKDTIERNAIDPLAELFGPLGPSAVVHTRGANTATILGRLVHVLGANDAKAEGRLRGITLTGAYVDEATLVPEAFWTQLQARLSVQGARLYATTNPDNPRHWLRKDYLLRADDIDLNRWKFTLDDNPALDPGYVTHLKQIYTGLWYRRFIDGEWVAAEGAIYDMLDLDAHVTDERPRGVSDWWLGIDYGTTNPFVALLFAVGRGADGIERVWVVREWRWDQDAQHGRRLTDVDYSRRLAKWISDGADGAAGEIRLSWAHVDPAAAHFIVRLHDDRWVRPAGATNAVVDGIQTVGSLLATDRLRIHRSCETLVDELAGYVWDQKKSEEEGRDEPVKVDDHGPDALRYGVMGARRVWDRWLVNRTQVAP